MPASDTSRALVGSSHSSTAGGTTVARANATRWRCPPDSWPARDLAISGGRPTRRSPRRRPPLRLARDVVALRQPLGDRAPRPTARGSARRPRPGTPSAAARRRSSSTAPVGGLLSPAMTRSRVDLPEPLSPTSATDSPCTVSEIRAQGMQFPAPSPTVEEPPFDAEGLGRRRGPRPRRWDVIGGG